LGVSLTEARALLALRRHAKLSDELLSLGRPEVYLSQRELRHLISTYNLPWTGNDVHQIASAAYAEPFLRLLGFRTIRSLDVSGYQGADIIHDLNVPIPKELEGATTFLFGNGTLEHVFDIATAFENIIRLVKVGGMVFITAPANGYCGHGFYQFSPEFFYNALSVNQFDQVRVYIVGRRYPQRWFRAANPLTLQRRIEFCTAEPTDIVAIARKAKSNGRFVHPQQSDYALGSWQLSPKESEIAHASWALRPAAYSKLLERASLTSALVFRYLFGYGMPGVPSRPYFDPIDPATDDI
jgi:hypothetical protein